MYPLVKYDLWDQQDILGHPLKALFMLIIMAWFPASYFIHVPRYDV